MSSFVHLRLHTEFSLADSVIRVEAPKSGRTPSLASRVAELGFPAAAITDRGNLFALVKFYKSAEAAGVKPIAGADLLVQADDTNESSEQVTLLALDNRGFRHLLQLVSQSYLQGQSHGAPGVRREWLASRSEGLAVLLGRHSRSGRLLLGGHAEAAGADLVWWRRHFTERLYLEVQRCGRPDDEPHVQACVRLTQIENLPLVATNDVRFLSRDDFGAHEARVCIQQGRVLDDPRRPRDYTPEQYLKSADEMRALFADLPEALENAVELARRCTVTLSLGAMHLPEFPLPAGKSAAQHLREEARKGLESRISSPESRVPSPDLYRQRLEYELDVIEKMGFAGYFLIVADFIAWAKTHGVPVGPGRGSGAGSLVAYAVGITDLDPVPYDLLFERFLNPERVSLPDFDVDFCMEGRDRVIEYVAGRYGRDHVGQIITYGTMAARAVVRDVARVLGHPYELGDRIAKLIPGAPAFKVQAAEAGFSELEYALREIPELKKVYDTEADVRDVIDLALPLEGLVRNVGKHAGGVVIAPGPLSDYAPLYCEPGGGGLVTQFDMKDLEAVGLVKFDFLGLRTLTIIQAAVDNINARHPDAALDVLKLPLDDQATYDLFASGHTTAVFQMESSGMQRLATELKPDRFEDIIALIALFRPGPMELIPEYIRRKRGETPIAYLHPELEAILAPTYGIMVYQEQVMQIAQKLAGYTLGGADLLRRAMGKKKPEEMAKQREVFIAGAVNRGIEARTASQIFDLMEKFAEYGFNKSHSAAYALIAYQTAWLKVHYPAEFMAAVLSCEMNHTDTVVMMTDECRRMGLAILAPDVNRSGYRFSVVGDGEILYGLGAIKGVGEGAIAMLVTEREKSGPFTDLFDLCRRLDPRKANKRVLEALIAAGACDGLGRNRATLMKSLPTALQLAEQASASAHQVDLFGLRAPAAAPSSSPAEESEWPEPERLRLEKETLGLYLSGHPIEIHRGLIQQICGGTIKQWIDEAGEASAGENGGARYGRRGPQVVIAGWVIGARRFGRRAVLTLDDRTAQIACPLNEEFLGALGALPKSDALLFVCGRISPDAYTGGWQIYPRELFGLDTACARYAQRLLLKWPGNHALDPDALMASIKPLTRADGCRVTLRYRNGVARVSLDLPDEWRVGVNEAVVQSLRRWLGEENVHVIYRRAEAVD